MKPALRLFLVLVTLAWTASQASAIPGRAEVTKVVGTATVSKSTGSRAPVTTGMVLGAGDTVTTDAGSTVDFNLGINGEFLHLDPDTTLSFDTLDIANVAERKVTTQLSVPKGKVAGGIANKLSLASKYEIRTPSGVAGIRGTKWMLVVPPGLTVQQALQRNAFNLVVTEGTVTFTPPGATAPVTVDATRGPVVYAYNTTTGQVGVQPLTGATVVNPVTGGNTTITARKASVITRDISAWIQQGSTPVSNITVGTITNPADVSTSAQ